MEFQFTHRDFYPEADGDFPNQSINSKNVIFKDGTTWPVVLEQFLDFLGSVYGYDIRKQVKYATFTERMEALSEDYPEAFDDEEDPFDTEGREFR